MLLVGTYLPLVSLMTDLTPSKKAREQLGRIPTRSTELYCKYCDVGYLHPQRLKVHVFMAHWDTNRRRMYMREEEYVDFMEGKTPP